MMKMATDLKAKGTKHGSVVMTRGDVTDIAWVFCVVGNELPYNLSIGDVLIIIMPP